MRCPIRTDETLAHPSRTLAGMSDALTWADVPQHLTGFAYLSTAAADATPHIAVVAPAIEGSTIWIGTNQGSRTSRNLAENPRASLVCVTSAEVYVWGDAELVDDIDVKRRLWTDGWSYDPAMFFESVESPDYVLVRITPHRAMVMTQDEHGVTRRRWQA